MRCPWVGLCQWHNQFWWFNFALCGNRSHDSYGFSLWQVGTPGQVWCGSCLSKHGSTPLGLLSPRYRMAQQALCWIMALPFGLHSAPYTFNSLADLEQQILVNNNYYKILHLLYCLDDFKTVRPLESLLRAQYLQTAFDSCHKLSLPVPSCQVCRTFFHADCLEHLARFSCARGQIFCW